LIDYSIRNAGIAGLQVIEGLFTSILTLEKEPPAAFHAVEGAERGRGA